MFNPFAKFEATYIAGFRKKGMRYLVSQTCKRALEQFVDSCKTPILLTHYNHLEGAKMHLQAIKAKDKYAAIIDLENEKHRQKLQEMLQPDSLYAVFTCLVTDREQIKQRLKQSFPAHIKRYVSKYTSWRIRGNEDLRVEPEITFGDIYVVLKYGSQYHRVRLDEIERA